MTTRIKFTRIPRWWVHTDRCDAKFRICSAVLNRWVGGIGRAKTMYLCFSTALHSPRYAYEYHFSVYDRLVIHTENSPSRREPFMAEVSVLLHRMSIEGSIPRRGWGWVEYEE